MAEAAGAAGGTGGAGEFQVKVSQPGKGTNLVTVHPGMTVAQAVQGAGFPADGLQYRVGTNVVEGNRAVQPGDLIMVTPRLAAGRRSRRRVR